MSNMLFLGYEYLVNQFFVFLFWIILSIFWMSEIWPRMSIPIRKILAYPPPPPSLWAAIGKETRIQDKATLTQSINDYFVKKKTIQYSRNTKIPY